MKHYQLDIVNHLAMNFGTSEDTRYWDAEKAVHAIEMKHSEYFHWEGDEQESLSRSTAINLAEQEINEYVHLREYLSHVVGEVLIWDD